MISQDILDRLTTTNPPHDSDDLVTINDCLDKYLGDNPDTQTCDDRKMLELVVAFIVRDDFCE